MALTPEAQRRAKHELVTEVLRRTARVDVSAGSAVELQWNEPARDETGYRTRVRVHISENAQLGFLTAHTHDLVPIRECLVASHDVNRVLQQLQGVAAADPQAISAFQAVEIRVLGDVPDLAWVPRGLGIKGSTASSPSALPSAQALQRIERILGLHGYEVLMAVQADEMSNWRANAQAVSPDSTAQKVALLFAPGAFTQVNWRVNVQILDYFVPRVKQLDLHTFADLYCGAGNFSLPLLAAGLNGCGVDSSPLSVSLLRLASERQGLGGAFSAEPVHVVTQRWAKAKRTFDLVIVDPPRAGFKEAVAHVAQIAAKWVFLCACDPVTFARDIRTLLDLGLQLESVTAFDMFPQTHHVELTAWLSKPGSHLTPLRD